MSSGWTRARECTSNLKSVAPDETVRRAVDPGAELIGEQARWRTLVSPGGLPFCVLAPTTEHRNR
jgi:hypothetical protein